MPQPKVPPKRADALRPGDRIAPGFLPLGDPAEVLFTYRYTNSETPWVTVVHRDEDGLPDVDFFLAEALVPLESAGDGLDYSREPDDPTPVSPARVPLHVGEVRDGDQLVTGPDGGGE